LTLRAQETQFRQFLDGNLHFFNVKRMKADVTDGEKCESLTTVRTLSLTLPELAGEHFRITLQLHLFQMQFRAARDASDVKVTRLSRIQRENC